MNGLIRMVINMVLREGVNRGVDAMAKRRTDAAKADPVAKEQAAQTNKRTRQSMRILRRFLRF